MLKDFKMNPTSYTKEKTEQLLKPYKDSGELDYLMKNKEVLEAMLKNTSNSNPSKPPQPIPQNNPPPQQYLQRESWEGRQNRQSRERSNDRSQRDQNPMMGGFNPNFVPKADKFRTVPCKYFHRYYILNLALRDAVKQIIAPLSMMRNMQAKLYQIKVVRTCRCRFL